MMHRLLLPLLCLGILNAETLTFEIPAIEAPSTEGLHLGTATNPDGRSVGTNSRYLTLNGKPWMPVMGEFHFSRCPANEWREELLRMKAGGIDIVATYVFWNHHEEEEGVWRWDGQRDLRRFVELCKETGMFASIRLGPWCHGEVRNGGVPDWALEKGWKLRSNDSGYLKHVETIYGQIARQLDGLLWKDGGPVIIAQVENEYRGPAEHLLALKKIAIDAGIDVPIYTRTGWPALSSPMPFGEIMPLFGAYAEGFWDRNLQSMPGKYWAAFRFANVRTDAAIATEQLGDRAARDEADAHRYPYLTCELGGGMMSSYHRRILMQPEDILAVALTKVGSGGNLPGYYMYHGGVNPDGKLHPLNEVQSSPMTNYNDMPVKNYDFQAPLGSFGETRPHYHSLRRMHLMFRDFGPPLATMPVVLPTALPGNKTDLSTLRASLRTNGKEGFLFVNNHQRGATMPRHEEVKFKTTGAGLPNSFPAKPVAIESGAAFMWPVDLDFGFDVKASATAQPICTIDEPGSRTVFLAETPGVTATLTTNGITTPLTPGGGIAHAIQGTGGEVRFVLLNTDYSLALWKGPLAGRDRVVLSRADVLFDQDRLELRSTNPNYLKALVYPPLEADDKTTGIFGLLNVESPSVVTPIPTVTPIREAAPPREVSLGRNKVAAAPTDDDFNKAATWTITLPNDLDLTADNLLRIHYTGDVARLLIGGKLVMDDFHHGRPLDLGLARFAEALESSRKITLEILPIPEDAPIYHPAAADAGSSLALHEIEIVHRYRANAP